MENLILPSIALAAAVLFMVIMGRGAKSEEIFTASRRLAAGQEDPTIDLSGDSEQAIFHLEGEGANVDSMTERDWHYFWKHYQRGREGMISAAERRQRTHCMARVSA